MSEKIYRFADFNFNIDFAGSKFGVFETKNTDIDLDLSSIKNELCSNFSNEEKTNYISKRFLEILTKISVWLPTVNSFLLHSVAVDIDGVGMVFSAHSGTGKSTHLSNWMKYLNGNDSLPVTFSNLPTYTKPKKEQTESEYLKNRLKVVNGDKPIVRFFDEKFCKDNNLSIPSNTEFGIPYAYGTPWCGKEMLGCNMRTPLKHICFIERSETNFVTKIDKKDAVDRIMQQVYMPKDPVALLKTLELVNRLISCCDLWIIHCNMDIESAEVAYKTIFNKD